MLPVSVEQSKAQRIQRQQARFRDRGGAFVPSEKNPLIDILLSRTVSGESPSKISTRSRSHSVSPSKARCDTTASKSHESPFRSRRSNINTNAQVDLPNDTAVPGPSTKPGGKATKTGTKKKAASTRKGKGKTKTNDVELSEEETPKAKPAPKRKGRPPKNKAQVSDLDVNAAPEPPKRKAKASKARPPSASTAKGLADVLQLDDEDTLVETPRLKSRSKRKPVIRMMNSDGEDEFISDTNANTEPTLLPKPAHKRSSAEDAPLHRARAKRLLEDHTAAEATAMTEAPQTRKPSKLDEANINPAKPKTDRSMTVDIPIKKPARSSERSALDDEDAEQPTKKAKVAKVQSARSLSPSRTVAISKAEDSTIKKPNSTMKKVTKRKKERLLESEDEDTLPKKPTLKRARFVEEPKLLVQISSEKKKENIVARKTKTMKPTSRSKSRGPPQDVLERIKATVTFQSVDDSAPDPLDCLS